MVAVPWDTAPKLLSFFVYLDSFLLNLDSFLLMLFHPFLKSPQQSGFCIGRDFFRLSNPAFSLSISSSACCHRSKFWQSELPHEQHYHLIEPFFKRDFHSGVEAIQRTSRNVLQRWKLNSNYKLVCNLFFRRNRDVRFMKGKICATLILSRREWDRLPFIHRCPLSHLEGWNMWIIVAPVLTLKGETCEIEALEWSCSAMVAGIQDF